MEPNSSRYLRIKLVLLINIVFFLLQLIVGCLVSSLALVADSFNIFNDVCKAVIKLYTIKICMDTKKTHVHPHSYERAKALGTLINGIFSIALCFSLFLEAIRRIFEPIDVSYPSVVILVGVLGLIINTVGLLLLDDVPNACHSNHPNPQTSLANEANPNNSLQYTTNPEAPCSHQRQQSEKKSNGRARFLRVPGCVLGNSGVFLAGVLTRYVPDIFERGNPLGKIFASFSDPVISLIVVSITFAVVLPQVRLTTLSLLKDTSSHVDSDGVEQATNPSTVHQPLQFYGR